MPAPSYDPRYLKRRSGSGSGQALSPEEYAFLLDLMANPPKNYEPVTVSSAEIVFLSNGDIVMQEVSY